MSAKPTAAPWADAPFQLITTPSKYMDVNSHSAVWCASEMSHAHNMLIRGLNAIVQQGPYVLPSSEADVKDFLFYVLSWLKSVDHHHSVEELTMFPAIEKLAGENGIMDGACHQHEQFHDGLMRLKEYTENTKLEDYRWEAMKAIIDSFSESLVQHLYSEIGDIKALERFDSDGLRKVWAEAEKVAKAEGNIQMLYDVFPLVLGCCDKTYESGNDFPPLPSLMVYAIRFWFGASHSGSWRFNPCDVWGQPKPLAMIPSAT